MGLLLMIVPSRGRPKNIERLLAAMDAVGTEHTDLLVAIDDDDPHADEYRNIYGAWVVSHPRMGMNGTLNKVAVQHADLYEHIGFMGDDHRPRTQGWDVRLMEACGSFGLAYADDLLQREALPTAVVMSANIVRTLGYMAPPVLRHMYLDNFWLELGRRLDAITYCEDVILEHVHPVANKAVWDTQYHEVNALMGPDGEAFARYVNDGGFDADVKKLEAIR